MSVQIRPARTIDDVIDQLDLIIERCIRESSRLGYFAMLYRNVTVRVRDEIAAGRFEDGPRMERLDVIFANRYLEALDTFGRGERVTASWQVAFQTARLRSPIIFQHLLLGMNAHINLDLAIAAAQTSPKALPGLKRDFYEITVLLDEMIDNVQARIDQVSPWFNILDRVGGRTDETICAFAIGAARSLAWRTAEQLTAAAPEQFESQVAAHDHTVAALGHKIRSPGHVLRAGLALIRARELKPVPVIIQALQL